MPFFSKKVDPKAAAKAAKKDTKREVRQSQRDIDRELRELDRTEKQVTADIKRRAKAAGSGPNDPALKSMAKQLVQIRKNKEKMMEAKAHLGAVGMQATSMAAQVAAGSAIGSVTSAMATANSAVDPKQMQQIMAEFTKQTEVMNVREELMDDALTDAFDSEELDQEADEVTNQVLAELGVELDSKLGGISAPTSKLNNGVAAQEEEDALPDLKARLNAL